MDAGFEGALEVVVAISDPEANGLKRIGLPSCLSDWGQESGVSPGNCPIGGFISAAVNPGGSAATLGCATGGHDLPEIGGIENQLAYDIAR